MPGSRAALLQIGDVVPVIHPHGSNVPCPVFRLRTAREAQFDQQPQVRVDIPGYVFEGAPAGAPRQGQDNSEHDVATSSQPRKQFFEGLSFGKRPVPSILRWFIFDGAPEKVRLPEAFPTPNRRGMLWVGARYMMLCAAHEKECVSHAPGGTAQDASSDATMDRLSELEARMDEDMRLRTILLW